MEVALVLILGLLVFIVMIDGRFAWCLRHFGVFWWDWAGRYLGGGIG